MSGQALAQEQSWSLALELRIDAACQSFEAAWKAAGDGGPRPRVEDYLAGADEADRSPLLGELLKLELHYRRAEAPGPEEYRQRFPEYGPLLDALFEQQPQAGGDRAEPATGSEVPDARDTPAPGRPAGDAGPGSPTLAGGGLPSIPGYEVLRVLSRGGQGVVYQARHVQLKRLVALKMILAGGHASEQERQRFVAEAEAVARLQHPNIVQIYEVGEHDGLPYLALEFKTGGSLAQKLDGTPLPARQAAELLQTLAQAVHHAHQHGIIHRDLKPANVLLTGGPGTPLGQSTPKITDFGLAKKRDDPSGPTPDFAILGTPSYMAPEQAAGHVRAITARTDVYALGAILYELLTGRPPFRGETIADTLELVRTHDPVSPRRLQPKVPRDLETICLRCLHKEPRRRYPSARKLAGDLRRYLSGQPIRARPVQFWERGLKWARRRPAVAALTLTTVLLGSVALGTVSQWRQSQSDHEQLENNLLYYNRIGQADRSLSANSLDRAGDLLGQCRPELRCWEWKYLTRLCQGDVAILRGHLDVVNSVAYSPDGKALASGSDDGKVRFWDPTRHQELCPPLEKAHPVTSVAFSQQGNRFALACADLTVEVWDVTNPQKPQLLHPFPQAGTFVAISRDGNLLATGGQLTTLKVWDLRAKHLVPGFRQDVEAQCAAFSSDGQWLATGSWGAKAVRIWNVANGREGDPLPRPVGTVNALAFHPDRKHLAVAGQRPSTAIAGAVSHLDLETGAELHLTGGYTVRSTSVAFSPNGKYLAATFLDGTVTVWDTVNGKVLFSGRRPNGLVGSVVFSPGGDNEYLAYAREQEVVLERWKGTTSPEGRKLGGPTEVVQSRVFSPDGRRLAAGDGKDPTVRVWDTDSGEEVLVLTGQTTPVECVAFSRTSVAGAAADGTVRVWDAQTGQETHTFKAEAGRVSSMAFSQDGGQLAFAAAAAADQTVRVELRVWELADGKAPFTLRGQTGAAVLCMAFSPKGRYLAWGSDDGTLKVWDLVGGKAIPFPKGHGSAVWSVAFSPDDRWLASASTDQQVKLWDARSGKELRTLYGHTGTVFSVTFSPDGRRLVSAGLDGTLKIWNPATGQEVLSLREHPAAVTSVVFSPDGHRVVSSSLDGTVKMWDGTPPE
jgi:WD40 repeat protein